MLCFAKKVELFELVFKFHIVIESTILDVGYSSTLIKFEYHMLPKDDQDEKPKSRRKRQSSNIQRISSARKNSNSVTTTTKAPKTTTPAIFLPELSVLQGNTDPSFYKFLFNTNKGVVKDVFDGLELDIKLAGVPGVINSKN
jgi:hypothetical protein